MPAPARHAATEQSHISYKRHRSITDGLAAMAVRDLLGCLALRFESEIFFADLYTAEDFHPVTAVLALAVALYFEFHFFFADLYA
jgi:hypothetical protein